MRTKKQKAISNSVITFFFIAIITLSFTTIAYQRVINIIKTKQTSHRSPPTAAELTPPQTTISDAPIEQLPVTPYSLPSIVTQNFPKELLPFLYVTEKQPSRAGTGLDYELNIYYNVGDHQKLSSGPVPPEYAYFASKNLLAYIEKSAGGAPDKVILFDVTSKNKKTILSYDIKRAQSEKTGEILYQSRINSVAFNNDGSKIYIASTEWVREYDISDQRTTTLLDRMVNISQCGGPTNEICSTHVVSISPDNSQLILLGGFWEGGKYQLLDVLNNESTLSNLELSTGYGPQDYILGWADNQSLLIVSQNGISGQLQKYDVATHKRSTIQSFGEYAISPFYSKQAVHYFIISSQQKGTQALYEFREGQFRKLLDSVPGIVQVERIDSENMVLRLVDQKMSSSSDITTPVVRYNLQTKQGVVILGDESKLFQQNGYALHEF